MCDNIECAEEAAEWTAALRMGKMDDHQPA
jgi:hypothetical protein